MIVKDPLVYCKTNGCNFYLNFTQILRNCLPKKALAARPSVAKPGLQSTLYVSVCIMCAYQVWQATGGPRVAIPPLPPPHPSVARWQPRRADVPPSPALNAPPGTKIVRQMLLSAGPVISPADSGRKWGNSKPEDDVWTLIVQHICTESTSGSKAGA